jgi:hypothetical protein
MKNNRYFPKKEDDLTRISRENKIERLSKLKRKRVLYGLLGIAYYVFAMSGFVTFYEKPMIFCIFFIVAMVPVAISLHHLPNLINETEQIEISLGWRKPDKVSYPDLNRNKHQTIESTKHTINPITPEKQDFTLKTINRQRISENVQIFVWNRDNGRCVKCGSQEKLEFDHIIPISKGGSNTARNIQLLCEKCNRAKRNKIGG